MRNRDFIPPAELITLFFELMRCKDKNLRKYLEVHIIADLKNLNAKQKNVKVNSVSVRHLVVSQVIQKEIGFIFGLFTKFKVAKTDPLQNSKAKECLFIVFN